MAKKKGKKRPLVGAAKAAHERKLGGKLSREQIETKWAERMKRAMGWEQKARVRQLMAFELARGIDLLEKPHPDATPLPVSFIGQPRKEE